MQAMGKNRFNDGPGPSQRQLRVGELIRRTLSDVLARGDVHDPDLGRMSITVGEVRTSPDLKVATVYVLPLGGEDAEAAARGEVLFADNCSACHGEDGAGDQSLGAPNLTDAIWLYGGEKADVVESIANSRRGVMPHWQGRLDEVTIKLLTLYVHSLGGGQ